MQTKLHTPGDDALRDLVLRQLEWELQNGAQDIAVSASQGAVTLTGFAHTLHDKRIAAKAAKAVCGVRAIANDIQVRASRRTDGAIARDIVHALTLDAEVRATSIRAQVMNGLVTLEGVVDRYRQREAAAVCVAHVQGVRRIVNNITLTPALSIGEIKTRIDEALHRNANKNAGNIIVSAVEGVVTLTGRVCSFAERDEAMNAAWAAPGVIRVENQISVNPC
jgi:osmotically-inducible protein OsmY